MKNGNLINDKCNIKSVSIVMLIGNLEKNP